MMTMMMAVTSVFWWTQVARSRNGTGRLAARSKAVQAGLDRCDVPEGARVAVVSHNSARLLELLLAVPSSGRILVPINFRLQPNEVSYIVDDCEADVLLVDPELDGPLAEVSAPRRLVLGEESDEVLLEFDTEPQPWSPPDEDAIATLNYTWRASHFPDCGPNKIRAG